MMRRFFIGLMMVLLAIPVAMATGVPDDDDKDPVIKPGIRRLHPGRERAKAIKKLQEQMSRKAEPKADPWDTSDEVWGTVDLPPVATRDSNAVEGRRLTPGAGLQQAGDESLTGRGGRRMTWRDLPVTATIDQLMPGFTVAEDGDYYSRYVSRDESSNEVYFVFNMQEDSVPGPLRLCVQYCGNDPLDLDQLLFTIDGFDYPFYPSNTRGGELEGNLCWAQSDDELKPIHKDLVFALAHGHWVAIKLLSTRGISHVKMLTDGQRDDFAHTLDLYRLMGGKL